MKLYFITADLSPFMFSKLPGSTEQLRYVPGVAFDADGLSTNVHHSFDEALK